MIIIFMFIKPHRLVLDLPTPEGWKAEFRQSCVCQAYIMHKDVEQNVLEN